MKTFYTFCVNFNNAMIFWSSGPVLESDLGTNLTLSIYKLFNINKCLILVYHDIIFYY